MDWTNSNEFKRKTHWKRGRFEKSTSEPNLSAHFTPRFPDNLAHLLHEYVTVDELKFYRKKRPQNIDDEFHSKDSICLYDKNQPIIPFASLKSEYTKRFGKLYSPRSRSVPNKINLNATTKELLEALQDDFSDLNSEDSRRGKSGGETENEGVEVVKSTKESNAAERPRETHPTQTFKVQGEFSYSPDNFRGEFKGTSVMERSESASNPQSSKIKFYGNFFGRPEYNDSFKVYNHFTKSAPIKAKDQLCVNRAIITPNISPLSEYTDQFKELSLHRSNQLKISKQLSNVRMRNNLMIGHSDQHVFPEYFESYKNPHIQKLPERAKARSPILEMTGSMDYRPEYKVKFTEFPRRRPVTHRPESNLDFLERSRKSSPVRQPAITTKYNPQLNVAIVEPSQNLHEPPKINQDPFYLCQPEVRKARHEMLIKKRPASSRQIIASARSNGHTFTTNEDEENRSYNERSRIIRSPVKPPINVTIENFDEEDTKTKTTIHNENPVKYGRRAPIQMAENVQAKRNLSKIIEGNYEYATKKKSLSSSIINGNTMNTQSVESPSFVILKDPIKQNKWMQSSWYL
ncbi:uncharacterized protein LOC129574073 [Sitodiplosis mosellana]|uniref:uncharacterized protein LOC129574073 n=1 Tax=Sitodiplosis mosellana TaxID=263140 RepID=UPI002444045D|nr:uncharacterized protein LOC129574073 [Sitodiplosis mosellana]XP_055311429.1 uncharacterized protein LOC129574073 [Sitodiplosis mosellana]